MYHDVRKIIYYYESMHKLSVIIDYSAKFHTIYNNI